MDKQLAKCNIGAEMRSGFLLREITQLNNYTCQSRAYILLIRGEILICVWTSIFSANKCSRRAVMHAKLKKKKIILFLYIFVSFRALDRYWGQHNMPYKYCQTVWSDLPSVMFPVGYCKWAAARSKTCFGGRSQAGIAGSNPSGGMAFVVSVVCSQVEVSATGWSLVQSRPSEYGVSECDLETWRVRRPWPTRGLSRREKKKEKEKFCTSG